MNHDVYYYLSTSVCVDGDVRITREMLPQIYWNHKWNYICHRKFTGNKIGVGLFCKRLLSSIDQLEDQKVFGELLPSNAVHLEATFLFGSCKKNDSWPYCTGGCNTRDLGGRCYQKDPSHSSGTTKYFSCNSGKGLKFGVKCRGKYDLPISSCPGNLTIILRLDV